MTLPQYYELCQYWAEHPPLHELIAACLGIRPSAAAAPSDLRALMALAPGGTLGTGGPR